MLVQTLTIQYTQILAIAFVNILPEQRKAARILWEKTLYSEADEYVERTTPPSPLCLSNAKLKKPYKTTKLSSHRPPSTVHQSSLRCISLPNTTTLPTSPSPLRSSPRDVVDGMVLCAAAASRDDFDELLAKVCD